MTEGEARGSSHLASGDSGDPAPLPPPAENGREGRGAPLPSGTVPFRILSLTVFLLFSMILSGPVWDYDTWWHLASGREIVRTLSLPSADPFTFIPPSLNDPVRLSLLQSYWLFQTLLYGAHAVANVQGLIVLRLVVLLSIILLVLRHLVREGCDRYVALAVTILVGWQMTYNTSERPQIVSFLFFGVLLVLLRSIGFASRDGAPYRYRPAFLLPPLMLLWANSHPGFILGNLFLILYAGCEWIKRFIPSYRVPGREQSRVLALVFSSLVITLCTPPTWHPYLNLIRLEGSDLQRRTTEYLSPLALYTDLHLVIPPYLIMVAVTAALLVLFFRRMNPTPLLMVILLAFLSTRAFRYVPFFVIGSALLCAPVYADLSRGYPLVRKLGVMAGLAAVIVMAVAGSTRRTLFWRSLNAPVSTTNFPVAAADELERIRPPAQIFNHFDWGGYLSWRLHPSYRVFIDGRTLSFTAFDHFTRILWEDSWKGILERYGVRTVVFPGVDGVTGELYALVDNLYRDPDWQLVYHDATALVLVDARSGFPMKPLPKEGIYRHVIERCLVLNRGGLATPHLQKAYETARSFLMASR